MSKPASSPEYSPLTMTQWLICVIAAIGFAFDIYELLMLPLIAAAGTVGARVDMPRARPAF